jgi:aspartyl-tRNA(Asn)/glutamyl-tRNA(Gln) amidotransferase subunit A
MDVSELKGVRVGIPMEFNVRELAPEVVELWNRGAAELAALGCEIVPVSMPSVRLALPCYYVLAPAEASSNLARYDGLRYGYSSKSTTEYANLAEMYQENRSEGFGDEVRRRILTGSFVLSSTSYSSFTVKAQQIRRKISDEFETVFSEVDFLLTPTSSQVAPQLSEAEEIMNTDPVKGYSADVMTTPANLAGIPAISVPGGVSVTQHNLPLGLQLMGDTFSEETGLFELAQHLENS